MALFIPTYFSPIVQYSEIFKANEVTFELDDNFQKQTYRNRCYIYTANGKLSLNIPIKHLNNNTRKKTKETLVSNEYSWQSQHYKSLTTAYRSSPFFEFYKDDLEKIFTKKYKFLQDVTIDSFLFITDALELPQSFIESTEYEIKPSQEDFRNLAIAKNGSLLNINSYTQIFDEKHGFIPNLSILDLLFMEGPNTISFLEKKYIR